EPPLVSGVAVHAPSGQDASDYAPLLSLKAGQRLSLKAVRQSVQTLYGLNRFANVSVLENPDGPGRVQLVFVLEPQRTITALSFSGAVHLAAADLRTASGLQVGSDYSEDRVQAARASLKAAYARMGWNDVRIDAQARPGPEGMDLSFAVLEGAPTRVASLELAGDPGGIRPAQVFPLQPGDILDRDVLAADVARLKALLKSGGRYRAQVDAPQIVPGGPGQAIVRLLVQAGPRIQLRYQGNR